MNGDIEKVIENSIKTNELDDLTKELGEVALDSILDDGILKDLPIFSTISAVVKIGINIKERIFVKKILRFLFELKEVPLKERNEFVDKINNDSQFESKVGESIIMIIDKTDTLQKSNLLGKLLAASIREEITYNQFLKLSSIINRAYVPTLYKLLEINRGVHVESDVYEELFNLNLVTFTLVDDKSYGGFSKVGRKGMPARGEKPEIFNQKLDFKISKDGKVLIDTVLSNI